MDASSKDFADNFGEYMRKAVFTQMFAKGYEDELRKWYESFSAAMGKEGGITSSDIKDLREGWDTIVNGALEDRKAWEQIVGGGTSTSQESSKKGFGTEMTHEDAGELRGRFTALQIAGEEIKNQMIAVVMGINSLTSISSVGNEVLNNILTQHVITNSYLDDIAKYTKLLNDIKTDISEVRINTKGLSTR